MEQTEITFYVDRLEVKAIEDLRQALAVDHTCASCSITTARGMDGLNEIILLVGAWGALTAKQLAAVLIAWIQRNDKKAIDLKKMTFRGFNAKDLERILNIHRNTKI